MKISPSILALPFFFASVQADTFSTIDVTGNATVGGTLTVDGAEVLTDEDIDPNTNIISDDYVTSLNRFVGDQNLFHPLLTNILFLAQNQYTVTATLNGSAHSLSPTLFDGSIQSGPSAYAAGSVLEVIVDFTSHPSYNVGIGMGAGELVVSTFNGGANAPDSVEGYVYVGSPVNDWVSLNKYLDPSGIANGDMYGNGTLYRLNNTSNLTPTTKLKIVITMDSVNPGVITELEFHPRKPTVHFRYPVLAKHYDEYLYKNLSFIDSSKAESIKFEAATGKITANEIDVNGFTLGSSGSAVFGSSLAADSLTTENTFVFQDTAGSGDAAIYLGVSNPVLQFIDTSVILGQDSGSDTMTGVGNIVLGNSSGQDMTTGYTNVAIGYRSLQYDEAGRGNVAIGPYAMNNSEGGENNVGIGAYTLSKNTGNFNVAIGHTALRFREVGSYMVAVGQGAMGSSGAEAIPGTTYAPVAVGYLALNKINSGNNVTALGAGAGRNFLNGNSNTFLGSNSAYYATTGAENLFVGFQSGMALTSGSYNTFLGTRSGDNLVTGDRNIAIGHSADLPQTNASDQLNIGNVIYGDLANDKIGIGVTDPEETLHVGGNVKIDGVVVMSAPAGDISMGPFGAAP